SARSATSLSWSPPTSQAGGVGRYPSCHDSCPNLDSAPDSPGAPKSAMSITLHNLHPNEGSTRPKTRLRPPPPPSPRPPPPTGQTSEKGGSGHKAGPAPHGGRFPVEGGQMPMPRRVPKRGFKNAVRVEAFPRNVATLAKCFDAGEVADLDKLRAKGLVPKLVE